MKIKPKFKLFSNIKIKSMFSNIKKCIIINAVRAKAKIDKKGQKSVNDIFINHEGISVQETNIGIEKLNDDCLREIFQHLTVFEKIKVEGVCKRWEQVSLSSWNSFKTLNTEALEKEIIDKFNAGFMKIIFRSILSRGGFYLRKVTLYSMGILDCRFILNLLIKYSANIVDLIITGAFQFKTADDILKQLFLQNQNLKRVAIIFREITGECLLSLPFGSLESIYVNASESCANSDYFKLAFSKLKNLKTLFLDANSELLDVVLKEATKTDQNNLSKLVINAQSCKNFDVPKVTNYFSKMKKLNHIVLNNLRLDSDDLISLPMNELKSLNLQQCEINSFNHLPVFLNLEEFQIWGLDSNNLTDAIFPKLINLKVLRFVNCNEITLNGVCNFLIISKKLELFSVNGEIVTSEFCDIVFLAINFCNKNVLTKVAEESNRSISIRWH